MPLLGLLTSQGVRGIATRLISSGLSAQRSSKIGRNLEKAAKQSISKGKIPTDEKLIGTLSKKDKILLSNPKYRKGLLGEQAVVRQGPTGQISGMPVYGTRTGGEITRISLPQARITNQFPVPAGGVSPLEQIAARSALAKQRAGAAMINKPMVQTVDKGLTGLQTTGLLGGLSVAPMLIPRGEQPQPVMANAVGAPQVAQTPQEQEPRFGQVLRPSSESTSKEVINAALLRAGLTLLRGGTGTEALESAASIADAQTTYRTGAQALKAGQEALGKDAQISIYQRSDGTFGYSGTTPKISTTGTSFFNDELGSIPTITTKKEYDDLPSGAQYYTTDSEGNPQLSTKP
jgi:hypothetical protein